MAGPYSVIGEMERKRETEGQKGGRKRANGGREGKNFLYN